MFVAPADMLGGDSVAAAPDSGLDSLDMELGTGKAHVPDVEFDAL